MKTHTYLITTLIAILISTSALTKQKFYKWTDENGNTHYTSKKPEHIDTDEVQVNTNQPKTPQIIESAENVDSIEKVETDVAPEKTYLEQRREKKQNAKEMAHENTKQCQKARQNVTKYQQKVRMSKTDKKTGEKVYLEDSKRAELIKKAQKAVKKYC